MQGESDRKSCGSLVSNLGRSHVKPTSAEERMARGYMVQYHSPGKGRSVAGDPGYNFTRKARLVPHGEYSSRCVCSLR